MIEKKLSDEDFERITSVMPDLVLAWKVLVFHAGGMYTLPRLHLLTEGANFDSRLVGYHCLIRAGSAICFLNGVERRRGDLVQYELSRIPANLLLSGSARYLPVEVAEIGHFYIARVAMFKSDLVTIGREPVFDRDQKLGDLAVASRCIYVPAFPCRDILSMDTCLVERGKFNPKILRYGEGPDSKSRTFKVARMSPYDVESHGRSLESLDCVREIDCLV